MRHALDVLLGCAGCGKTTWAVQHAMAHPEKRFMILGVSFILEQMRVRFPEKPMAASFMLSWGPSLIME